MKTKTNPRSRILSLLMAFAMIATLFPALTLPAKAAGQVEIYPNAPTEAAYKGTDFGNITFLAGGKPVSLYGTRVNSARKWTGNGQTGTYKEAPVALFGMDTNVQISVTIPGLVHAKVTPQRKHVASTVNGTTVTFTLPTWGQYVLEWDNGTPITAPDSPNALMIFANPLTDQTKIDNADFVFEPGYTVFDNALAGQINAKGGQALFWGHGGNTGTMNMKDDSWKLNQAQLDRKQQWYIKPGAVIKGGIGIKQNCSVYGYGVITLRDVNNGTSGISIPFECYKDDNLVIDGVTILDPEGWNMQIQGAKHVKINNVKIMSARGNSDGISIQSSQDVEISNCFLRTWDDAVVIKNYNNNDQFSENVRAHDLVLWTDFAQTLEIGYETNKGNLANPTIHDITFENIDILHAFHKAPISVHNGDNCDIYDIVFRNIVVEDAEMGQGDGWNLLIDITNLKDSEVQGGSWTTVQDRGEISNVTIDGLYVLSGRKPDARIANSASGGTIAGLKLNNVSYKGEFYDLSAYNTAGASALTQTVNGQAVQAYTPEGFTIVDFAQWTPQNGTSGPLLPPPMNAEGYGYKASGWMHGNYVGADMLKGVYTASGGDVWFGNIDFTKPATKGYKYVEVTSKSNGGYVRVEGAANVNAQGTGLASTTDADGFTVAYFDATTLGAQGREQWVLRSQAGGVSVKKVRLTDYLPTDPGKPAPPPVIEIQVPGLDAPAPSPNNTQPPASPSPNNTQPPAASPSPNTTQPPASPSPNNTQPPVIPSTFNNPIIRGYGQTSYADSLTKPVFFSADPSVRVINGKLYMFPSHDMYPARGCDLMDNYHVFSSTNVQDWKDEGQILSSHDLTWGAKGYFMWAPDCIEGADGKFYFYYPHVTNAHLGIDGDNDWSEWATAVAVADRPEGPYTDLGPIPGTIGNGLIDPNVFCDTNGDYYLYWGGGQDLYAAKLGADMKSITGKTLLCNDNQLEGAAATDNRVQNGLNGFHEGSWMFKRGDTYYLTYAGLSGPGQGDGIAYATASSPMGPFTYKGALLNQQPATALGGGTSHGSVVEYPVGSGKWYIFYHNMALSGSDNLRSVCVSEITFAANGDVIPVDPAVNDGSQAMQANKIAPGAGGTWYNINQTAWTVGYDPALQAVSGGNNAAQAAAAFENGGTNVGGLNNPGAYTQITSVNGGAGGRAQITVRYASNDGMPCMRMRVNGVDLQPQPAPGNGGWGVFDAYVTFEANLTAGNNTVTLYGGNFGYNPNGIYVITGLPAVTPEPSPSPSPVVVPSIAVSPSPVVTPPPAYPTGVPIVIPADNQHATLVAGGAFDNKENGMGIGQLGNDGPIGDATREFYFDIPVGASVTLNSVRYGGPAAPFGSTVNFSSGGDAFDVTFTPLGWGNFGDQTIGHTFPFNTDGRLTVRVTGTNAVDIVSINVTYASPIPSPEPSPIASPVVSPAQSPETSPVNSPETSPVTSPETSPATSPETSPATSPETSPATSPEPSPVATEAPFCWVGFIDGLTGYQINDWIPAHQGEKIAKPADPTEDGYIFLGWVDIDGRFWDFENDTLPAGQVVLYSAWQDNHPSPSVGENDPSPNITPTREPPTVPPVPSPSALPSSNPSLPPSPTALPSGDDPSPSPVASDDPSPGASDEPSPGESVEPSPVVVPSVPADPSLEPTANPDPSETPEPIIPPTPVVPTRDPAESLPPAATDPGAVVNPPVPSFDPIAATAAPTPIANNNNPVNNDGGTPTVKYTVTFKNGSATVGTRTVGAGQAAVMPAAPSLKGYTFLGWTDASGGLYRGGVINGNTTFTAKFQGESFVLTFNAMGGKIGKKSTANKTVTVGKTFGKLATPKRAGYKFLGFYTKQKGGTKISATSKVAAGRKVYYAHWKKTGKK